MKTKLTITFLFFFSLLQAQNLLKSIYDLEMFPQDMKQQKEFIDETISNILVYNFIHGGPGNSQFDLKSDKGVKVNFPFKDSLWLTFLDSKTNQAATSYTIHYTYDFKYHKFYDDAEITDSTFSNSTIFDLATKYYDYDEYVLINKVLNNYKLEINFEDRRTLFFNELAGILVENEIDFNTILTEEEKGSYIDSEIEEIMLDAILEETDFEFEEIILKVFEHFILDNKDNSKTKENISKVFEDKKVFQIIEEKVLQPHIRVSLLKGGFLHIPKKYATFNTMNEYNLFPIDLIIINIDFKNKEIVVSFENKDSNSITIPESTYQSTVSKNKNIKSKKINMKISNSDFKLEFFEYNPIKNDIQLYEVLIK